MYVHEGKTIIYFNEYNYKSKTLMNETKVQNVRVNKFIEKLTNQGITFQRDESRITFHWKCLYNDHRGPGKRIAMYEMLLKKQKIRFIKTMDDVKATFIWGNFI